ncbi:MAG: Hsp33 family molecular chaperone HslO [Planctomycetota bacterium]
MPGRVLVRRMLDEKNEAIYARGDFTALSAAYDDHARLWQVDPDPLGEIMMHQLLGGSALYLSSRPHDENLAWTLNIKEPAMNLFATGSTVSRGVTGCFYAEDVQTAQTSRLYVDSRRSQGQDRRSVVEVEGLDVLQIFEQYSRRSDQAMTRYFELDFNDYLMVASLPVGHHDWIEQLDRDQARKNYDKLRSLDEREFWFQCGCSKEKVAHIVTAAWADDRETLFSDRDSVDVTCPRCGRRWPITPKDFSG